MNKPEALCPTLQAVVSATKKARASLSNEAPLAVLREDHKRLNKAIDVANKENLHSRDEVILAKKVRRRLLLKIRKMEV